MRKVIIALLALVSSATGQLGVYRIGDYSIQVQRYTNHDFGIVASSIPSPPEKLDGFMVLVFPAASGKTAPDRIDVTIRYRDSSGRVFARTQSMRPVQTPQFVGTQWMAGDAYIVGSGLSVLSVSVAEVMWHSVEESRATDVQ